MRLTKAGLFGNISDPQHVEPTKFVGSPMKTVLVAILLAACAFQACQNSSDPTRISSDALYPRLTYGPYKAQNPFDSVGIRHNDACEYIYNHLESDDSTIAACVDAMSEAIVTLYGGQGISEEVLLACSDTVVMLVDAIMQTEILDVFTNYNDTTVYSATELAYFNRIGAVYATATTAQEVMDSLAQIENSMLNANLGSNAPFYSTFSVLKHSFYYWNEYYPWGSSLLGTGSTFEKGSVGCYSCMYSLMDALGEAAGHAAAKKMGLVMLQDEYWMIVEIYANMTSNYYYFVVQVETTLPPARG